jgi:hypothetical protein
MLGGTDLLQQQAQAAQAQATQQYHQQQAALLGHKRPMNGMMDPAAAAALPGMVPMGPSSGSGLMAMQQQQYAAAQAQQYAVQQAHAQQYAAVYGAGGYAQQPGGYGVPPGMVPGMMQPMANGYEDPAAAAAKRVRQEPTNQQLLAKARAPSLWHVHVPVAVVLPTAHCSSACACHTVTQPHAQYSCACCEHVSHPATVPRCPRMPCWPLPD